MNIGFDAKRALYNRSGLGNYSRLIINSLHANFPCNNYFLYAPQKKNPIDFIAPDSSIRLCYPRQFLYKLFQSYWRSVSLGSDLVKDHIDLYHGLSGEIPKNIVRNKVKSIVTIHDLIFLRYPELYKAIDRKIYEKKFRFACENTNGIIAISKQTKQDLVGFFGVDPAQISVIYQGCDKRFMTIAPEAIREEVKLRYQLPGSFLLYVGTIEKRKNLLNIVKAIYQESIDMPLVAIGRKTEYFAEVQNFIAKNGMSNILFPENVTNDDLPAIYQMAEGFIYPSIFEGFGIPIIESLFSETPVITTKGGCFPEAGGKGALYVNPDNIDELGNSINLLLSDSPLREKLIKNGSNHSKNFLHEKLAGQMMGLYKKISGA